MKKLPFIIILFFLSCATATIEQRQDKEVVDLPNMNKEQIFNKSIQWIATSFKSANAIIQYKDIKEGSIICKVTTTTNANLMTYYFHTTMTIDIKDNKSRFTFLANEVTISDTTRDIYGQAEADLAKESFKSVKLSYKDYMLKQTKKKDDNW